MDRAEAIKRLTNYAYEYINDGFEQEYEAVKVAVAALREQEQREQGCEYCQAKEVLYQHTNTTKLYINTFGQARTLVTKCNACPPYANCGMKNIPARSAFIIKFCPECGRKLTKEGAEG